MKVLRDEIRQELNEIVSQLIELKDIKQEVIYKVNEGKVIHIDNKNSIEVNELFRNSKYFKKTISRVLVNDFDFGVNNVFILIPREKAFNLLWIDDFIEKALEYIEIDIELEVEEDKETGDVGTTESYGESIEEEDKPESNE